MTTFGSGDRDATATQSGRSGRPGSWSPLVGRTRDGLVCRDHPSTHLSGVREQSRPSPIGTAAAAVTGDTKKTALSPGCGAAVMNAAGCQRCLSCSRPYAVLFTDGSRPRRFNGRFDWRRSSLTHGRRDD